MIGIYEIRNIVNDKVYVGSSCNIIIRFNEHKRQLRNNNHHNIKLQRAYNKYGKDAFIFTVLYEVETSEGLKNEEQKLLDLVFKDKGKVYNIAIDAIAPTRGLKHSQETIAKQVALRATKEWKAQQSATLKEYFSNPDAIKKASEAQKLKWADPTHKKKVMEAVALARLRPEVREKRAALRRGKTNSEESKKKLSKTLLEKYSDPEYKKKISDILSSEEVRKSMSEGATKRWANADNKAEQAARTSAWFSNPENRARNSEKTKAYFANPENRRAASLRQPSKLSAEDIKYIKEQGVVYGMQTKLCKQFNICKAHCSNIVNNKRVSYTASL